MNKTGHFRGGLVVIGVTVTTITLENKIFGYPTSLNIPESLLLSAGVMLGSFVPDIDAEQSYFNYNFPYLRKGYKLIQWIAKNWINVLKPLKKNQKCLSLSELTYNIFKHRGVLMHGWLGLLILILLYNFKFHNFFMLGTILGFIGHLICDMIPEGQGLKLFYPFIKKEFKL